MYALKMWNLLIFAVRCRLKFCTIFKITLPCQKNCNIAEIRSLSIGPPDSIILCSSWKCLKVIKIYEWNGSIIRSLWVILCETILNSVLSKVPKTKDDQRSKLPPLDLQICHWHFYKFLFTFCRLNDFCVL